MQFAEEEEELAANSVAAIDQKQQPQQPHQSQQPQQHGISEKFLASQSSILETSSIRYQISTSPLPNVPKSDIQRNQVQQKQPNKNNFSSNLKTKGTKPNQKVFKNLSSLTFQETHSHPKRKTARNNHNFNSQIKKGPVQSPSLKGISSFTVTNSTECQPKILLPRSLLHRDTRRLIEAILHSKTYLVFKFFSILVLLIGNYLQDLTPTVHIDRYWDALFIITVAILMADILFVSFTAKDYFLILYGRETVLKNARSKRGLVDTDVGNGDDHSVSSNSSGDSEPHFVDNPRTTDAKKSRTYYDPNLSVSSTYRFQIGSFAFWFDLISTLSLLVDITFIHEDITFIHEEYPLLQSRYNPSNILEFNYEYGIKVHPPLKEFNWYLFITFLRIFHLYRLLLQPKPLVDLFYSFRKCIVSMLESRNEAKEIRRIQRSIGNLTPLGNASLTVLKDILEGITKGVLTVSGRRKDGGDIDAVYIEKLTKAESAVMIQRAFRMAYGLKYTGGATSKVVIDEKWIGKSSLRESMKETWKKESRTDESGIVEGVIKEWTERSELSKGKVRVRQVVSMKERMLGVLGRKASRKEKLTFMRSTRNIGFNANESVRLNKSIRLKESTGFNFGRKSIKKDRPSLGVDRLISINRGSINDNSSDKKKSILGDSLMNVAGDRVTVVVIFTVLMAAAFTHFEQDKTPQQTLLTLHNAVREEMKQYLVLKCSEPKVLYSCHGKIKNPMANHSEYQEKEGRGLEQLARLSRILKAQTPDLYSYILLHEKRNNTLVSKHEDNRMSCAKLAKLCRGIKTECEEERKACVKDRREQRAVDGRSLEDNLETTINKCAKKPSLLSIKERKKCSEISKKLFEQEIRDKEEFRYDRFNIIDSDLRPRERFKVTVCITTNLEDEFSKLTECSTGLFDISKQVQRAAAASLILTIYFALMLCLGVASFSVPVSALIVIPIQRSVRFLGMLIKNPLGYDQKTDFHKFEAEEDGILKMTGWRKEVMDGMEPSFLRNTISRISDLMKVGYGSAGVDIISSCLGTKTEVSFNNLVGSNVHCIFVFCDIRRFTDITECLQEEIFVFTNRIAQVVHSFCSSYGGSANMNFGDAFLVSWKLDLDSIEAGDEDDENDFEGHFAPSHRRGIKWGKPVRESTQEGIANEHKADNALLSVVKIAINLQSRSYYLKDISESAKKRLKGKISDRGPIVKMGFGLHAGKAVEAAIGTARKLDATYISAATEHVEYLESSTKKYGVELLMSREFRRLLPRSSQRRCRMIDRIRSESMDDKGLHRGREMEVHTLDFVVRDLMLPTQSIRHMPEQKFLKRGASTPLLDSTRCAPMDPMDPMDPIDPMDSQSQSCRRQSLPTDNSSLPSLIMDQPEQFPHNTVNLPSGHAIAYDSSAWLKEDIRRIRRRYSDGNIRRLFDAGLKAYFEGKWMIAKNKFESVLICFDDGPSKYFLERMKKEDFVPPPSFDGYGSP